MIAFAIRGSGIWLLLIAVLHITLGKRSAIAPASGTFAPLALRKRRLPKGR